MAVILNPGIKTFSLPALFAASLRPTTVLARLAVVVFLVLGLNTVASAQPVLVQTATGVTNGGTSVSATFSSTPIAGNLLIAIAGNRDSSGTPVPQTGGWTSVLTENLNSPGQIVYYKIAGASEGSAVGFTSYDTSTRLGLQVYEYSGVSTLVGSSSASGTGTAISANPATTTGANQLVLAAIVQNQSDSTSPSFSSWPGSFTERHDFINGGSPSNKSVYGGGDATSSGPGFYSPNITAAVSAPWRVNVVVFKAPPLTTLGDGTDPVDATLVPGGAATMIDTFNFQTNDGTDTITAVTVMLKPGSAGGLSLVEITNGAGSTVYGSVADPGSDTLPITLTTNITAATGTSTYKIRVTPKSHANMPAPTGSEYSMTAMITAWTGTNAQAGSDAAGTTVKIDNLSPGNVTGATATPGSGQVSLSWTNPTDPDLDSIVVLRRAGAAVADVPAEGATYTIGNTIGASTVALVVTAPTAGGTDTGLSGGTAYHYKVFTKDSNGNYSATGVVPTGSPATPVGANISGTVFEDVNYGGGAGRSLAASSGVVRSGARVELYDGSGNYSTFTTTDGSGDYSFPGLAAASYTVRVVSTSVTSSRTGYVATLRPVQTFRTDASTGTAVGVTDYVGGHDPATADAGNAAAGWTLTATGVFSGSGSGTAHAFAPVTVSGADVTDVDFGWNFDTIVNKNDTGQGSLRQFMINADTLGGDASLAQSGHPAGIENAIFMISNGSAAAGLRGANNYFSGGVATIAPTSAMRFLDRSVTIDATTQPGYDGTPSIDLNGALIGGLSDYGFATDAGGLTIRGFVIRNFTGAAIHVSGSGTHTIQSNYIGTDASGTSAQANGLGIYAGSGADSTIIGGSNPGDGNIISGNTAEGIWLEGVGSAIIRGNYIGVDAAGTGPLGNTSHGILLNSGAINNTIGGTASSARNIISGNLNGVRIADSGTYGNVLINNYIGTDKNGTAGVGNDLFGVSIGNGAGANTVGGSLATQRNVISGNQVGGVELTDDTTDDNQVLGNYIGVDVNGNSAALANDGDGIYIFDGATANIIGAAGARNVISANTEGGIRIVNAGSTIIQGNYIGLEADGSPATPHGLEGISLEGNTSGTVIGGTNLDEGNVISGNDGEGIAITGTSTGTVLEANYIGTNATGLTSVANGKNGVLITTGGVTVGGSSAAARNVISGNTHNGVLLSGAGATGNTIKGNYIGVDSTGAGPLGNTINGVLLNTGASNNVIGGTASTDKNVIAYNGADGVTIVNASIGNGILGNEIYANGGVSALDVGVDLADDGVTANNGTKNASLPNSDMDFPVFTSATLGGTTLTVAGYVGSAPSQSTFASARVEIFKSDNDASGNGEGPTYYDFLTTDASGNFSGSITVSGLSVGDKITGTATDGSNNTSEFGANFVTVAATAPLITVTKSSAMISDPVNNTTNPKRIPGAIIEYSITADNSGDAAADADSAVVTDVIDSPKLAYEVTTGVTFTDGTTSSGLALGTVTFSDDASPGPYTYDYTPVPDGDGFDGNITSIKFNTTGAFTFGGSPAPSFTVKYRTKVK